MSIRSLLTTLSVLTLTINVASAQNYSGTIAGRDVTASVTPSKSNEINITFERITLDHDVESTSDALESFCLAKAEKPLGSAEIDFGFQKISASLKGVAFERFADDGSCLNLKMNITKLKFNVQIDLNNKNESVSFYDHSGRLIIIYNHSMMSDGIALDKLVLSGASYSRKGDDCRETLDENVNTDLVLNLIK
ncbi:MAG: hypothetical protein KA715_05245 [Xanthomonadaceae bacterium]|nr:hypothetical protein [Xanthomonadaceae bacterium]